MSFPPCSQSSISIKYYKQQFLNQIKYLPFLGNKYNCLDQSQYITVGMSRSGKRIEPHLHQMRVTFNKEQRILSFNDMLLCTARQFRLFANFYIYHRKQKFIKFLPDNSLQILLWLLPGHGGWLTTPLLPLMSNIQK